MFFYFLQRITQALSADRLPTFLWASGNAPFPENQVDHARGIKTMWSGWRHPALKQQQKKNPSHLAHVCASFVFCSEKFVFLQNRIVFTNQSCHLTNENDLHGLSVLALAQSGVLEFIALFGSFCCSNFNYCNLRSTVVTGGSRPWGPGAPLPPRFVQNHAIFRQFWANFGLRAPPGVKTPLDSPD